MPTLECFSEVSSESVNYKDGQDAISENNSVTVEFEDDKEIIILKDPDYYENISSLRSFHIYVGEFKMNQDNECIIKKLYPPPCYSILYLQVSILIMEIQK